ncbi:MAG: bacteriohemerythrin [Terracidiphilus sp.]
MALLTWSHTSSVGVQAMDDQHGILMDTMNELHSALVRGCSKKQLDDHLNRLIEFSRLHFICEEQLLERHGFPGLAEHRVAHQFLLLKIQETVDRVEHAESIESGSLLTFLRTWYSEHIQGLDHQYGSWLNERGIF